VVTPQNLHASRQAPLATTENEIFDAECFDHAQRLRHEALNGLWRALRPNVADRILDRQREPDSKAPIVDAGPASLAHPRAANPTVSGGTIP
jgi:hypothetical protein